MTPERWQQIKGVLDRAVALPAGQRGAFLAAECAGDRDLQREVESLLASHDRAGHFLNEPAINKGEPIPAASPGPGGRVGRYVIVERIGRGGMGEVFAAVRADGQYERNVAIKVVRAGLAAREALDRFRAERQILAGLDHPNIARLFDGGATESGAPYLVMELVDGVAIDEYCRSRSLSIAERLRLFVQVCSAVQYAHQRLVIHRDLKPGNILVTADGVPKLLDFGIAKVLDPVGGAQETELRPFTPEYASPEQVRGEPVSTASDVYALGVVLYQLLTGASPYRPPQATAGALADAITTQHPERPSTAAPALRRELGGDLDAIVLKALRKEPEHRYASVEQFADDVRRHLRGAPVTARKGTWTYLSWSFARRHRAAVSAAALVLATLVAGVVVTAREARIAEANRRRADARFNDVRKLANSLLFEVHDSIRDLPGATDARKLILQRSLEYLDSLAKESANEPGLTRELAAAYDRVATLQGNGFHLGIADTKGAAASFEKSLALREALARANPRSDTDQVELAGAYTTYGEFQNSVVGNLRLGFDYEHRALEILDRQARKAPDDERVATLLRECLITLGIMQVGNGLMPTIGTPAQGIADLTRALGVVERAVARDPSRVDLRERLGSIEGAIAQAWMTLGDRPQAIVHFQRGADTLEPLARGGKSALAAYNASVDYERIGDALLIDGRIGEALPYYEASLRWSSSLAAADAHNGSARRNNEISRVAAGHALVELGRIDEGMDYIRTSLREIEADNPDVPLTRAVEALIRGWYGEGLERQGKVREALAQYTQTKDKLAVVRAKAADDVRMAGYYAAAIDRVAAALAKLGEMERADREYDDAIAVLEPLTAANPANLELTYAIAEAYTAKGAIAAARAAGARTVDARIAGWRDASAWHHKSLDAWRRVAHPSRISNIGLEVTEPAEVMARLARADREIAALAR